MRNRKIYESGQVLLITVLVLVVMITVGLSLAARSLTSTRITESEEETQKAFYAAEAGIERALTIPLNSSPAPITDSENSYSVQISPQGGTTPLSRYIFRNGQTIPVGDSVDVWLSENEFTTNKFNYRLRVFWGSRTITNHCDQGAIQVVHLSGDKVTPAINNLTVDPCDIRRSQNRFTAATLASLAGDVELGQKYRYVMTIDIPNGLIARIVPLYRGTSIAVDSVDASVLTCAEKNAQIADLSARLNEQYNIMQSNLNVINTYAPYETYWYNQAVYWYNEWVRIQNEIDAHTNQIQQNGGRWCDNNPNQCQNQKQHREQDRNYRDNTVIPNYNAANANYNYYTNLLAPYRAAYNAAYSQYNTLLSEYNTLAARSCDQDKRLVTLPVQGHVIESKGISGDTERTIRVFRSFPRVPDEFFPYVIYSPISRTGEAGIPSDASY